jgi:hypothetical protein
MTTKEIATVEHDAELVVPLTEGKAKQLDKRIRAADNRVGNEMDGLIALLKEAVQGQIHVVLGYPSWPAYVKDAVHIVPADREERKALAQYMSGVGASNRAIAAVAGVSEGTVRNDLADADAQDYAGDTAGLDGKTYKRKTKDTNIIDAEVVEDPEEEADSEPRKATDVIDDFAENMDYLMPNVQAFNDILADDAELLPKARKRIAARFSNRLQSAVTDLQKVVDELMV